MLMIRVLRLAIIELLLALIIHHIS